jgi:hypothetical protein
MLDLGRNYEWKKLNPKTKHCEDAESKEEDEEPTKSEEEKKAAWCCTSISDNQEQRLKRVDLRRIMRRPTSVNDNEEEKLKMLDLRRNHEWKKVRPKKTSERH